MELVEPWGCSRSKAPMTPDGDNNKNAKAFSGNAFLCNNANSSGLRGTCVEQGCSRRRPLQIVGLGRVRFLHNRRQELRVVRSSKGTGGSPPAGMFYKFVLIGRGAARRYELLPGFLPWMRRAIRWASRLTRHKNSHELYNMGVGMVRIVSRDR